MSQLIFEHIGDALGKPVLMDSISLFQYCYTNKYLKRSESIQFTYICEQLFSNFLKIDHSLIIIEFTNHLEIFPSDPISKLFYQLMMLNISKIGKIHNVKIVRFSSWIDCIEFDTFMQRSIPSAIFVLNGDSKKDLSIANKMESQHVNTYFFANFEFKRNGIYSFKIKGAEPQDVGTCNWNVPTFPSDIFEKFKGVKSDRLRPILFGICQILQKSTDPLVVYFSQVLFVTSIVMETTSLENRLYSADNIDENTNQIHSFLAQFCSTLDGISLVDPEISMDLIDEGLFTFLCFYLSRNTYQISAESESLWKLISNEKFEISPCKMFDFDLKPKEIKSKRDMQLIKVDSDLVTCLIPQLEKDISEKQVDFPVNMISTRFEEKTHWHNDALLNVKEQTRYQSDSNNILSRFNIKKAKEISQWISGIGKFSSEKDKVSSVSSVIGEPTVYATKGKRATGWIPHLGGRSRDQFIEVEFETQCVISGIQIYETLNPGALCRISAQMDEEWILIHEREPLQDGGKSESIFSVQIDKKVLSQKLLLEFTPTKEFQIDAVKLDGMVYGKYRNDPNWDKQKLMSFYAAFSATLGSLALAVKPTVTKDPVVDKKKKLSKAELIKEENTKNKELKAKKEVVTLIENLTSSSVDYVRDLSGKEKVELRRMVLKLYLLSRLQDQDHKEKFCLILELLDSKSLNEILSLSKNYPEMFATAIYKLGYGDMIPTIAKKYDCIKIAQVALPREYIAPILPFYEYQLMFYGPYMKRSLDSQYDPRIENFYPDNWQRDLLNLVDARKSTLVLAPTSAGKTFISYYAMKKVIENNKDPKKPRQVVVIVVPTKALVNQICADIYQRYQDNFGVFTRETRKNIEQCSVLVTVPQCLEILFFSPERLDWVRSVQYIVFDEVHLIGAEDGDIWERLIKTAPCPFLALSATVGGTQRFYQFLQSIHGTDVAIVQYTQRYSDLENYIYKKGQFIKIHPLAPLEFQHQNTEITAIDMHPKDLYEVYLALKKVKITDVNDKKAVSDLDPNNYFTQIVLQKKDCLEYSGKIKSLIAEWRTNKFSYFQEFLQLLNSSLNVALKESLSFDPLKEFPQFVEIMREKECLPAIVFSFSKQECTQFAMHLLNSIESKEAAELKENGLIGLDDLITQTRAEKLAELKKKKTELEDDDLDKLDEWVDKQFAKKESAYRDIIRKYRLQTSNEKLDPKDFWFHRLLSKTKWTMQNPLIRALQRGIGIHHADLPVGYRNLVEVLFREKKIQIVFATGTLAFGINMPCRTTVFLSDSRFLTGLMYHQMRGRSGRRGLDVRGNSIFYDVSLEQAMNLMISPLADIRGVNTLTVPITLKIGTCFNQVERSKKTKEILSSLKQRFGKLLGPTLLKSDQAWNVYYYRFTVEFLIRLGLLSPHGDPIGLAEMVLHLSYEPGVFHLKKVFESDDFSTLCDRFDGNRESVMKEVLLLVAHVCGHIPVSKTKLALSPLDSKWKNIIDSFNHEISEMFQSFIQLFSRNRLLDPSPSCTLPLSGKSFAVKDSNSQIKPEFKIENHIRSPFVALSGYSDTFENKSEFVDTLRCDVPLADESLPLFELATASSAYAYDFYLSGSFKTINKDYGLTGSRGYNAVKNFNMTLKVLAKTVKSYFKGLDSIKPEVIVVEEKEESFDWGDVQDEIETISESITDNTQTIQANILKNRKILSVLQALSQSYDEKFRQCEEKEFHEYSSSFTNDKNLREDDSGAFD